MMAPYKTRRPYREVSLKTLLRYLRAYNGMQRGLKYVQAFLSGDPWALLTLLRVRNWSPIHHEPDTSKPTKTVGESYPTYIVGDIAKTQKRKVTPDHEPLGPEDYELGLKVAQAEADHILVHAFLDDLLEQRIGRGYR